MELNRTRNFIGIVLFLYLIVAVFIIFIVHLNLIEIIKNNMLFRAHIMCGGFGMLGAAISLIRKYYSTLITESTINQKAETNFNFVWSAGWIYYYLIRPIMGGVAGALVFLLSYMSVQIIVIGRPLEISSQGRLLLYALSFIAGFSVTDVLNKIVEVSKQVFKTKGKDN
jgi:hypothetical protein